ncbi:hypothetical protein OHA72_44005 [Dactylosporangium sp. NBC_01737]|uniref:hypothetical protein n=1 Tax=Dactylosporangium sp. NBC_01737 TaxID=2975959 RepID=UPI002E0F2967|nr:hypothetical protein OHA72_44005 [Dactylosporangium sp. NBC_01737]
MREVFEQIDDGDLDALAGTLAALDAKDRAALLPLLDAHTLIPVQPEPVPEPEPEPEVSSGFLVLRAYAGAAPIGGEPPRLLEVLDEEVVRQRERIRRSGGNIWYLRAQAAEAARRRNEQRHAAYSLAVVACVGTAAEAVKRLHAPWTRGRPAHLVPAAVPGLLQIRGADWCATLGRGMLRRIRSRAAAAQWPFTEPLLRAVGADAPEAPAAVACYVATPRRTPLAEFLAEDPWFDRMLPHLFDDNQVAAALVGPGAAAGWPAALLELAATGRIERDTLIAGCLRRLRAGGRPGCSRTSPCSSSSSPAPPSWPRTGRS